MSDSKPQFSHTILKEGIGEQISSLHGLNFTISVSIELPSLNQTLYFESIPLNKSLISSSIENEILSMRLNEIREIQYISQEKPNVIRVSLLKLFTKGEQKRKNPWDMDEDNERLELSTSLKAHGNEALKKTQYKEANSCYSIGIDLISADTGSVFEENKTFLQSNLILGLLKEGKPEKAKELAQQMIEKDASLVKIWYRKALAEIILGEFDAAKEDLLKAHQLDPQNQDIVKELEKLKEKERGMKEKAKAVYSKMFK